jgi:hypothetical protein
MDAVDACRNVMGALEVGVSQSYGQHIGLASHVKCCGGSHHARANH